MNFLVVDDDKDTADTIKTILSAHPGYEVDIAHNGREALDKMQALKLYDLVILDIMMPEFNGIDVLQTMIHDEKLKNIPVLLISALSVLLEPFQESREKFDELSIVKGVLEKPFSPDDLLVKVKAIVEYR